MLSAMNTAAKETAAMAVPGCSRWVKRPWREVAFVAALCLCLLPAAVPARAAAEEVTRYSQIYVMDPSKIEIGARVPAFRAKGINGSEVDFEALVQSGRIVILTFWSIYCKACVEKFSALVALQSRYEPQGLQVIAVNTDGEYREGEEKIREFLGKLETQMKITINFPVIYDDRNWIPHALGINFLPTIIAVDAQGRVMDVYQKFDEAGEAEIQAGIEAIVQKAMATPREALPPNPKRQHPSTAKRVAPPQFFGEI
jgi:alkyl hydroperoxide reductase subunit AhpC